MIKTKIQKESLYDWSVESAERKRIDRVHVIPAGATLAWITKDKLNIFTVTYTKTLCFEDVSPDICGTFVEAKRAALYWIDYFTKD